MRISLKTVNAILLGIIVFLIALELMLYNQLQEKEQAYNTTIRLDLGDNTCTIREMKMESCNMTPPQIAYEIYNKGYVDGVASKWNVQPICTGET